MSWKWTSATHLGDILDEDVEVLDNTFKKEIRAMTPSSSKSKSRSDFIITYHPESGKRLASRPSHQPKRQRSLNVAALPFSMISKFIVVFTKLVIQALPKLKPLKLQMLAAVEDMNQKVHLPQI